MIDRHLHRSFSVVVCAYTEERWEDILAAVDSVRGQSMPATETLLVVDHNEALRARLLARYASLSPADGGEVRVLANAGPRGLSAGRNTGIAVARGSSWPSWTTTQSPSPTGYGISRRGTGIPG